MIFKLFVPLGGSYIDPDLIAFSPNNDGLHDFVFPWLGMVRNAKYIHTEILDAEGNVIADLGTVSNMRRLMAYDIYTHGAALQSGMSYIGWDGTVYDQKTGTRSIAPEGDYTVRISSCIREDGDWQTITMPLAIDTTKPEITSLVAVVQDNGQVTVTFSAQDLHGLSNDVVFNINGAMDSWGLARLTHDEAADTYSITLSQRQSSQDGGVHVAVMVMDKAGNTTVRQITARAGNGRDAGFTNLKVGSTTYVVAAGYPYTYRVFGYAPEGSTVTVNGTQASFTGTDFMVDIDLTQSVTVADVSIVDPEGRNLLSGTARLVVDMDDPMLGALMPDGDFGATAVSHGYTLILDEDLNPGTSIPLKIRVSDQSDVTVSYTDYSNYRTCTLTPDEDGYVHFDLMLTQMGDDIYGSFWMYVTDAAGRYIGLEANVWTPTSARAQEAAGNVDLTPNLTPMISNLGSLSTVTGEALGEDGTFRIEGYLFNRVDRVTVNGTEAVIDTENLTWYCDIVLESGMNTIAATSYLGESTGHSGLTKLIYSESGPSLTMELPEEHDGKYHADAPVFMLRGTVATVLDDALVFVNDVLVDDYNDFGHGVNSEATVREFSYPVTLDHGDNIITVMAMDATGAETTITFNLYYCPSAVYCDVPADAWFHDAVDHMTENDIMNGMGGNRFAPEATTNRAMMAVLLYRIAGEPSVDGLVNPFTDVESGTWYYDAVIWAASEGIVNGKSSTIFAPADDVTREQMVTMLYRFAGSPETANDLLADFADGNTVSAYAKAAFCWAIENGIVEGSADGGQILLNPQHTANRAQIAVILMRYFEK